MAECLEADRRAVLALIDEARTKSYQRKATLDWQQLNVDVAEYLREHADGRWRQTLAPVLAATMRAQGEQLVGIFGERFDVPNLEASEWFQTQRLEFAQPILDTHASVLSDLFGQGQLEGWSTDRLKRNLEQIFQEWQQGDLAPEDFDWLQQRMPVYRRELIARDQLLRSANAGNFLTMQSWGVPKKEWLAAHDERTRDSHVSAGARYIVGGNPGPIPMGEPFMLAGGRVMFPGDPSLGASLAEIIECRCVTAPVLAAEA